ncbi:MAG: NADH-dependent [FeFe] hydrogenase, group A6 [Oscillospiraceae bacterium]|nr:NADH-dependent [FeFe] hydrogenase, group A6 [Oscillospiraceae bacterium]
MADIIKLKINGIEVEAPQGATILEAARLAGIEIPTLCYMKEINAIGSCRICVVEVKGGRGLAAACVFPAADGMEVFTNTEAVADSRRGTLELMLSNHRMDCLTCLRSQSCELQNLSKTLGVDKVRYPLDNQEPELETSAPHLTRDNSKCILCRRCVAVCKKNQDVAVIGPNDRGFATHIGCAFDRDLAESPCVSCGQCIVACPTGALTERDQTQEVWDALADPDKHVVVGAAPSVRVTLGECFGMPVGENTEGKMFAALRRLGFDKVFDVDTTADLTIMEEANEFIERVQNKGKLPLITSCSPGWVSYCERYYPEFLDNLSTCKSPQQMFGAMVKTYYAQKAGIDPKNVFVVTIMPCTAKKYEILHRDSAIKGLPDVDVALTTRELGRMIERAGLMYADLPDEKPDPAFSEYTGAGVIFGATGGVMEAALRTAADTLTGQELKSVDYNGVRGLEGVKEASVDVAGLKVNVAVASGTANAKKLLDMVKSGEKDIHFIEIMGCPGGCVNGGGQPVQPMGLKNFTDVRAARAKSLYDMDKGNPLRKSHDSPLMKTVYKDFLGEPGSRKAHDVLHTHYHKTEKYPGVKV